MAFRPLANRSGAASGRWSGFFSALNLVASFTDFGVFPALILARTGGDELAMLRQLRRQLGLEPPVVEGLSDVQRQAV